VYAIGDSLIGSDDWQTQPLFHLRELLGGSVDLKARGIEGDSSQDVLARLDRDVIGSDPKPGVCIVLAGINDIQRDAPAALVTGNLEAIYSKLLAARIQPVGLSIYPFGGYHMWTPGFEAVRQQVRTWMHRWLPVQLPEVEVVDVEDVIGDLSDPARPRLRAEFADEWGLHTNAAGAAAVARALVQRSRTLGGLQG
jgi:lysophospholipase L1-like esterase